MPVMTEDAMREASNFIPTSSVTDAHAPPSMSYMYSVSSTAIAAPMLMRI